MTKQRVPQPDDISLLSGVDGTFILDDPVRPVIRQANLIDRVIHFDNRLPTEVTRANRIETTAVFEEAREIARVAREVSAAMGCAQSIDFEDPPLSVPFDFDYPTYDEFEAIAEAIYQETFDCPDELFDIAPRRDGMLFQSASDTGPNLYDEGEDVSTTDGIRHWISKIFAAFGLKDVWTAVLEIIDGDYPWLLETIYGRIRNRNWRGLKRNLKTLAEIFGTRSFKTKLAQKIGVTAAARAFGKIAAKFVPIVGWVLLIGQVIWAIAEEFI